MYGKCILNDYNHITKDKCLTEFLKMKQCFTVSWGLPFPTLVCGGGGGGGLIGFLWNVGVESVLRSTTWTYLGYFKRPRPPIRSCREVSSAKALALVTSYDKIHAGSKPHNRSNLSKKRAFCTSCSSSMIRLPEPLPAFISEVSGSAATASS